MPPTKGKQATKGAKQIKEENKKTFQFYMKIIIGSNIATILLQFIIYSENLWFMQWVFLFLSVAVYVGSMMFMNSMAKSGLDLNMESGIGENLKDIIYVTVACQILSFFTLYFWFLWLVIPGFAFYKLWVNILSPWVFAQPPEISDKKKKKLERKQIKVRYQ